MVVFISWCRKVLRVLLLLPAVSLAQDLAIVRSPVTATVDEAPADLASVVLSVVALSRGLADPALLEPVEFAPGLIEKIRDPYTRFVGFDLEGFGVSFLGPSQHGQPGRRAAGLLNFVDASGRRAQSVYVIDYTHRDGRYRVEEAAVFRQTPSRPRVEIHVVRADRLPGDFFTNPRPMVETLALLRSLAMKASGERPLAPLYVFAINLDRLAGADRLRFETDRVSPQSLRDEGGWQLLATRYDVMPEEPIDIRVELDRGGIRRRQAVASLTLPAR